MHDTYLEGIKFNLDHFDRYQDTYFLAGWVHSGQEPVEALRVEAYDQFSSEVAQFEVRHDVNKFYDLPENTQTGFKFILTPDVEFPNLLFSVKLQGQDKYKVIQEVSNPRYAQLMPDTEPATPQLPAVKIGNSFPGFVVVENFYDDPDAVREYAMSLEFEENTRYHKGARTKEQTFFPGTKEFIESVLHRKITSWEDQMHNGVFQYCTADQPLVYHTDTQTFAAIVYLTPDAPAECGTSFYKSKHNGLLTYPTDADVSRLGKPANELFSDMFAGNFYDSTRWELVDVIGNVYNRMVIFDARKVHAASAYFGDRMENSRLFQMFFFDAE